jgi:hypothetical protein
MTGGRVAKALKTEEGQLFGDLFASLSDELRQSICLNMSGRRKKRE